MNINNHNILEHIQKVRHEIDEIIRAEVKKWDDLPSIRYNDQELSLSNWSKLSTVCGQQTCQKNIG